MQRLHSFRQGDRREAITLAFLRYLGFVAPVPREEDIGIDATLTISLHEGRVEIPKETALIQVKPEKPQILLWQEAHFEFFSKLTIPFFFVTRDHGKTRFYSTSRLFVNSDKNSNNFARHLSLGQGDIVKLTTGSDIELWRTKYSEYEGSKPKIKEGQKPPMYVDWLGQPIIAFTESELEGTKGLKNKLSSILIEHCKLEKKARLLGEIGAQGNISWETNCIPELSQMAVGMTTDIDKLSKNMLDILRCSLQSIGCCPMHKNLTIQQKKQVNKNFYDILNVLRRK